MTTTFGIDVSRYQAGLSLADAKAQGVEFVIAKASEGQGWHDPNFADFRKQAQDNGLLFAAYHFLRDDSPVEAQARNVLSAVGPEVPVILDVEPGTLNSRPNMKHVRQFVLAAADLGMSVSNLLYIPEWYWKQLGEPSLAGWDLWQSRYGNNPTGPLQRLYPGDDSPFWVFGDSAAVAVLQYGSYAKIEGFSGVVDANATKNTRQELTEFGWFIDYGKKDEEVTIPKEDLQKAVATAPVVTRVIKGQENETQTLQWVLRRLLTDNERLNDQVALLTEKVDALSTQKPSATVELLSSADVREAVAEVLRKGVDTV